MILGELLLPAKRLRQLTWDELDCIQAGQEVARQKALVPARLLATQLYNLMPGDRGPLSEAQYLPLWAVDAPPKPTAVLSETAQQFRDRLAAQNHQTLAARAAATAT